MKRRKFFIIIVLLIIFPILTFANSENDPEKYVSKAEEYIKNRDFNKAVEVLQNAILIDSEYDRIYILLGNAYEGLKKIKKAFRSYQEALILNPDNPVSHFQFGILLDHEKFYEEALIAFTRSIELNPKHPTPYYYRGLTLLSLKSPRGALENFKRYVGIAKELDDPSLRVYESKFIKNAQKLIKRLEDLLSDKKSSRKNEDEDDF